MKERVCQCLSLPQVGPAAWPGQGQGQSWPPAHSPLPAFLTLHRWHQLPGAALVTFVPSALWQLGSSSLLTGFALNTGNYRLLCLSFASAALSNDLLTYPSFQQVPLDFLGVWADDLPLEAVLSFSVLPLGYLSLVAWTSSILIDFLIMNRACIPGKIST